MASHGMEPDPTQSSRRMTTTAEGTIYEVLNLNTDWSIGFAGTALDTPPKGVYSFEVPRDKVGWFYRVYRRQDSFTGNPLRPMPTEDTTVLVSLIVEEPDDHPAGLSVRIDCPLPYLDPRTGDGYYALVSNPDRPSGL